MALHQKKWTHVLLLSLLFALASSVGLHMWLSHILQQLEKKSLATQTPWMTIFVHGSFATTLGLISVFNVIKDNVRKTAYKQMSRLMRSDPFFFQMQPLQELGLKPVIPSFELPQATHKYAVLPIAAAYEVMSDLATHNNEKHLFYTYGWSGLISQYRRRSEAIKFYRALTEEYTRLQSSGISPKIRLIAHSHGGNLILNMAGIHALLTRASTEKPTASEYSTHDELASMQALWEVLQKKTKEHPLPTAHFTIDEVIMLGTPIQPETVGFTQVPFFKHLYNLYSDDDIIQGMDWVSTRRYYSEKRIEHRHPLPAHAPLLTQIKITLNKPHLLIKDPALLAKATSQDSSLSGLKDTLSALWTKMFGVRRSKGSQDPLHKEFWFMSWKAHELEGQAQFHIQPYPYVILLPYIERLAEKIANTHDLDVHIKFNQDYVSLSAYAHDTVDKLGKVYIPRPLVHELQTMAQKWRPENVSPAFEMELLHHYSQMIQ